MRLLSIFKKSILELLRDKVTIILTILTPIFFILIFGLFFGKGFYTFSVAVSNEDKGELGQTFVQYLQHAEYENGNKVFIIKPIDKNNKIIRKKLEEHIYAAHLHIPVNFTEAVLLRKSKAEVIVSGDPGFTNYDFVDVYTKLYLNEFVERQLNTDNIITSKRNPISENSIKSEFDNMAPGLIIISVYFIMIITSMMLAREAEQDTMQRLLFSKLKSFELYLGVCLSQIILGMIMAFAAFASAVMLGYDPKGSIVLANLISFISNLSAIGIGMIIAAFSNSSMQAFILGNVVITPLFFISGVVVPPLNIKITELFGRDLELAAFLPTFHSVEAMKKILNSGAGFTDISYEVIFLSILTVLIGILGILLFHLKYVRKYRVY